MPSAVKAWNTSNWITREVPGSSWFEEQSRKGGELHFPRSVAAVPGAVRGLDGGSGQGRKGLSRGAPRLRPEAGRLQTAAGGP